MMGARPVSSARCFSIAQFEELDGGTFWLEEPTAEPPRDTFLGPKRICTWVRLRDRPSGGTFGVYNFHSYLSEGARLAAARIILGRIAQGDPADGVIVTGDFNAVPGTPDRLLFEQAGLEPSDALLGGVTGACDVSVLRHTSEESGRCARESKLAGSCAAGAGYEAGEYISFGSFWGDGGFGFGAALSIRPRALVGGEGCPVSRSAP